LPAPFRHRSPSPSRGGSRGRALGVSRGGFYAWLKRRRSRSDEELGAKVRAKEMCSTTSSASTIRNSGTQRSDIAVEFESRMKLASDAVTQTGCGHASARAVVFSDDLLSARLSRTRVRRTRGVCRGESSCWRPGDRNKHSGLGVAVGYSQETGAKRWLTSQRNSTICFTTP
jgi:hypothetical protein